jgi:Permuted papain-like amidase enzyme, YaeF/YiiX, C92 family
MSLKKVALIVVAGIVAAYLVLSIPGKGPPQMRGAGKQAFVWDQNEMWKALEARFREARSAGCPAMESGIRKRLEEGNRQVAAMARRQFEPSDFFFDAVESNLFNVGPLMAACPEHIDEYVKLVSSMREEVKLQSRRWDVRDRTVRDRLYRLLYGGRTALEEVMLQAPKELSPSVLRGTDEPSQTPSFQLPGGELHSGDILVSRGGAPTSALIARGNDYPGNFSHIAIFYVDENTHEPSVIEAHIERGVVISSLEQYLKDVKLRIMIMRVRADHPLLVKDPMLPHRAAKLAYDEVKKRHIPYDFAMDFREPSEQFCSEVASHAYSSLGVTLWSIITTMSSPGVVNWLGDFGVRYFETQAPADLEYDPQLVVVAEWRDIGALWDDHVDNAVTEAMLEKADRGLRLNYDWYLLAPARLVKGYSLILNKFGKVGPVPEGMSAQVALKSQSLDNLHKQIKKRVLAEAVAFEQKNGYRPPYWELVKMAGDAFKAQSRL